MKHLGLTETQTMDTNSPSVTNFLIYFNLFPKVSVDILSCVSQLVFEVEFFSTYLVRPWNVGNRARV